MTEVIELSAKWIRLMKHLGEVLEMCYVIVRGLNESPSFHHRLLKMAHLLMIFMFRSSVYALSRGRKNICWWRKWQNLKSETSNLRTPEKVNHKLNVWLHLVDRQKIKWKKLLTWGAEGSGDRERDNNMRKEERTFLIRLYFAIKTQHMNFSSCAFFCTPFKHIWSDSVENMIIFKQPSKEQNLWQCGVLTKQG